MKSIPPFCLLVAIAILVVPAMALPQLEGKIIHANGSSISDQPYQMLHKRSPLQGDTSHTTARQWTDLEIFTVPEATRPYFHEIQLPCLIKVPDSGIGWYDDGIAFRVFAPSFPDNQDAHTLTVSYFKWILLNKRGDLLPPPLRERYPNFVDAAVYVYIFPGRGQNRQRGDVIGGFPLQDIEIYSSDSLCPVIDGPFELEFADEVRILNADTRDAKAEIIRLDHYYIGNLR